MNSPLIQTAVRIAAVRAITLVVFFTLCGYQFCGAQPKTDSIHTSKVSGYVDVDLDSIQAHWLTQFDTVKTQFDSLLNVSDWELSKLRSRLNEIKGTVDSIEVVRKIDSLIRWKDRKVQALTSKVDSLQLRIKARLDNLPLPPELRQKADQMLSSVNSIQAPLRQSMQSNITMVTGQLVPGVTQTLQGVTTIGTDLRSIVSNGELNSLPDLALKEVPGIGQGTSAIKGLSEAQVNAEGLSSAVAESVPGNSLMSGVEGQIGQGTQLASMLGRAGDEAAVKQQLLQQVQEQAMDHFKGHSEKLNEAMNAIAKHKSRIPTATSLNDIPRRVPNEMKGKPFIERIVPGISFQLLKKDELVTVDLNVYAGYRFTKRLTAGAGWNERVGLITKPVSAAPADVRIYGPRLFSSFKLSRGFEPRIEFEVMNTYIPPYIRNPHVDPGSRRWVAGAFAGISKTYSITKRLRGTAMVMFRLFDPDRTSPYPDIVNARFGMELPLKSKRKK